MKFSSSLKLNHIFRRLYHTSGYADGLLVLYARRNRTRRRIREVYRLNEEKFLPGWDIVIVARTKAVDAEFAKLTKSCLTLAKKAGLLAPAPEEV